MSQMLSTHLKIFNDAKQGMKLYAITRKHGIRPPSVGRSLHLAVKELNPDLLCIFRRKADGEFMEVAKVVDYIYNHPKSFETRETFEMDLRKLKTITATQTNHPFWDMSS